MIDLQLVIARRQHFCGTAPSGCCGGVIPAGASYLGLLYDDDEGDQHFVRCCLDGALGVYAIDVTMLALAAQAEFAIEPGPPLVVILPPRPRCAGCGESIAIHDMRENGFGSLAVSSNPDESPVSECPAFVWPDAELAVAS